MWTIYSERLFQTQGTWACATAGGGWTCFKTGCMPSWVKAWKVDGGGWGGGARSTSRGAVLWWILALLRFPGLENSCWIMVFVTATLGLRGIWLSEGWGWVGTTPTVSLLMFQIWTFFSKRTEKEGTWDIFVECKERVGDFSISVISFFLKAIFQKEVPCCIGWIQSCW